MWGYHDVTDPSDAAMEPPVCWITNAFDRSPAELVRVESGIRPGGRCKGSLLNLSYGNGKVFVVPHEIVGGQMQGGMCALPIPPLPTGVMRGRFNPADGQLYTCGMFAWAGNQTQPGGFYRIRATGKPMYVPVGLHARKDGIAITFTGRLDRKAASDPKNYGARTWSLKRTANYGSDHIDERPAPIAGREGLRRRPHGVPRDPRDPADLVHGDHLRDPRRVGRGRRGRHRQHDPPAGRLRRRPPLARSSRPGRAELLEDVSQRQDHRDLLLAMSVLRLDVDVAHAGPAAVDRERAVIGDPAVVLEDDVEAAPTQGVEHGRLRHEEEIVGVAAVLDEDGGGIGGELAPFLVAEGRVVSLRAVVQGDHDIGPLDRVEG